MEIETKNQQWDFHIKENKLIVGIYYRRHPWKNKYYVHLMYADTTEEIYEISKELFEFNMVKAFNGG